MNEYDEGGLIPDIATSITVNTEQRTPCVLVLDCSTSMLNQGRMEALNRGLKAFEDALKSDDVAMQCVTLQVLGFGGNEEVWQFVDWVDAAYFSAPEMEANGTTPMGQAMDVAHSELDKIKETFRQNGVTYTRPWIFLMSDGGPNDSGWEEAAARSRAAVTANKAIVWPIAVPGADASALAAFAAPNAEVYEVDAADFGSLFVWLSKSLSQVASTQPGQSAQIEAPSLVTIPT